MMCQNCKTEFEPQKFNQRFCCPKCKTEFWNRETKDGIRLNPKIREQLKSYADAHNISIGEMADKFLHQAMNPDRQPLENIYGHDNDTNRII